MKSPINILAEIQDIVDNNDNDSTLGSKIRQYMQSLPKDLTGGVGK